MKQTIEQLIKEIKKEMNKLCEKVKFIHHKNRDGELIISYDAWNDSFYVEYNGYCFDHFTVKNKKLNEALEDTLFKIKEVQTLGGN